MGSESKEETAERGEREEMDRAESAVSPQESRLDLGGVVLTQGLAVSEDRGAHLLMLITQWSISASLSLAALKKTREMVPSERSRRCAWVMREDSVSASLRQGSYECN